MVNTETGPIALNKVTILFKRASRINTKQDALSYIPQFESALNFIEILVTCTGAAVNATVCGQTQINSNTKICCGSLPHARFIGGSELGCFQDKVFNKTEKVTCGDGLELRSSVEEIYTKDFICCLGQFHIKENDDRCCRGDKERLYKRRLQECCNGVVVDRKAGTAQVCRGTELVDRNAGIHRLRQCTRPNGQNTLYDSSNYVCCTQTDTPYILKAEECCENKVINRSKELCCKNNIVTKMHPSHYRCCNINHAWTTYNEFDPPKDTCYMHWNGSKCDCLWYNTNKCKYRNLLRKPSSGRFRGGHEFGCFQEKFSTKLKKLLVAMDWNS
ncbi:galaxin-like [Mya arenaria]|uniref:galaxin-like n=1 Tax=Mya arenaria TaxID=6604 RepID=UPI0022E6153F|nr:galaxin-like [Mya arenaria]